MTELGARLKEARVAKGFSIDDLQEITKIQKRYLSSIEQGNYATMPGAFYVRAFIKQYAEAVGLNGDELLETYKSEIPSSASDDVSKNIPPTPTRRTLGGQSSNRFMEIFPMLVVALFVVAIIVIVWTLFQSGPKDVPEEIDTETGLTMETKPPKEEVTPPAEEEPEEPVEEVVEEPVLEQQITVGATQGENTTYDLTGAEGYEVKVVATGKSWLSIQDQNGVEMMQPAREIQAGETFTLDASNAERIRIRVGSTPNASVYINDQLVEYPSERTPQNLVIQFNK
ncbi:RodZ domain-containing protein [Psychrobacillus sp. FSL H8-0483]|uniref:helix-turn-helix domain-containing protein n=1 Tax=Psychrobacillus sp. FSL H8-0483 TaxID=2921389 RepID=UPI00315ACF93